MYAKLQVVDNYKEPLLFTRYGLSSVNVYSHEDYWMSKDGICLKHELGFYRAMHFSAKRGIAIACRLSVRLSVTLVDCDHRGLNSSKIISPLVSLGCSLFATPT